MISKYLIYAFSICSLCNIAFSQPDSSEFMTWGAGIVKDMRGYQAEVINFPKENIILYNKEGKVVGLLFPDSVASNSSNSYWWLNARLNYDPTTYAISRDEFKEVTYEGVCLKYYEQKQQFIRILQNTFPDPPIYIKISDIKSLGYDITDWKDFIGISKKGWRRFDHLGSPLILRETPSITSNPILSFRGNLYIIEIIGPWKGSWVYVEVAHYSKNDMVLNESDILQRYRGWIKALDEKGFPNIWFITRD